MNKLITIAFTALKKGECLENPAVWKHTQIVLGVLVIVLQNWTSIDPAITTKVLTTVVAIQTYLTAATSERIGV